MKNNLFLQIKIIIITSIYIVCALSGALSGVLSGVLCSVLSGTYSTPHSTPQRSTIFTSFVKNKPFSEWHKNNGFVHHTKHNRGRWIQVSVSFLPDSSAHHERKRSSETC
jgi:hypothetical protein